MRKGLIIGLMLMLSGISGAFCQDMSFIESKAGFDKTKNARLETPVQISAYFLK